MNITIDHLSAGARRAEGVAVIIDVFRAYTVESYAFHNNVACIYPVADINEAYKMKAENPDFLLAGERHAKKAEGFDFGNSPSEIENINLTGKTLVHTTSAGTQGIIEAKNADIILVAALVNAKATAEYIKALNPKRVSLVCMGLDNLAETDEDTFCAEYIKTLLEGGDFDKSAHIEILKTGAGARFFAPENQSFSPERDFHLCTEFDKFPFALRIYKDEMGRNYTKRIDV